MTDLKPCPFCGGEADFASTDTVIGTVWTVECVNDAVDCIGSTLESTYNRKIEAATAWNTRAHDSVSFEAGERSMRDAAVKIAAQYVAYNPNTKFAVIKTHIAQRILDKLRKLPIKIKVTEIVE